MLTIRTDILGKETIVMMGCIPISIANSAVGMELKVQRHSHESEHRGVRTLIIPRAELLESPTTVDAHEALPRDSALPRNWREDVRWNARDSRESERRGSERSRSVKDGSRSKERENSRSGGRLKDSVFWRLNLKRSSNARERGCESRSWNFSVNSSENMSARENRSGEKRCSAYAKKRNDKGQLKHRHRRRRRRKHKRRLKHERMHSKSVLLLKRSRHLYRPDPVLLLEIDLPPDLSVNVTVPTHQC